MEIAVVIALKVTPAASTSKPDSKTRLLMLRPTMLHEAFASRKVRPALQTYSSALSTPIHSP